MTLFIIIFRLVVCASEELMIDIVPAAGIRNFAGFYSDWNCNGDCIFKGTQLKSSDGCPYVITNHQLVQRLYINPILTI